MSTFNPSVVVEKGPGLIEAVEHAWGAPPTNLCEMADDAAKQSGQPQFLKDAQALREATEVMQNIAKQICGNEGDTMSENGSAWAIVGAAKKVLIAVGGEA